MFTGKKNKIKKKMDENVWFFFKYSVQIHRGKLLNSQLNWIRNWWDQRKVFTWELAYHLNITIISLLFVRWENPLKGIRIHLCGRFFIYWGFDTNLNKWNFFLPSFQCLHLKKKKLLNTQLVVFGLKYSYLKTC